jgi:hypothetical protein
VSAFDFGDPAGPGEEVPLPAVAPELAAGRDRHPGIGLQPDGGAHGVIFNGPQRVV